LTQSIPHAAGDNDRFQEMLVGKQRKKSWSAVFAVFGVFLAFQTVML
jgi:hypothetical protein